MSEVTDVEFNLERSELVGELYDRFRAGLEVSVDMQERAHRFGIDVAKIETCVALEFGDDDDQ